MSTRDARFLDGQLLIAMPGMGDLRFERSVIFLCAHSAEGAMGLIVNKPAPELSFADLLAQLKIPASDRPEGHAGCISAGRSSTAAASCCIPPTTRSRSRASGSAPTSR